MGERIQLRRRLRQQRQAREAMLLDLGALVYELHRQGRRAPELLQQKAAELEVVDGEVRELEDRLAGLAPEGEPAWGEGEARADALSDEELGEEELREEELHEDFDELDEEEPGEELDEEEPGEELGEEEFHDELGEDELVDEGELDGDERAADEDDFRDDPLYPDGPPADSDSTVEVDALDGAPDDREARS